MKNSCSIDGTTIDFECEEFGPRTMYDVKQVTVNGHEFSKNAAPMVSALVLAAVDDLIKDVTNETSHSYYINEAAEEFAKSLLPKLKRLKALLT